MDKTREIMQKVRRIELQARRLATATLVGQYRASFRGQGLEFDDFREYQVGDEPRFIDWKVTARTNTPYVRRFHEEREQVLLLAVDASASMNYASSATQSSKLDYAALISAVLAYSAAKNGDKIGLLIYGREQHFYLPQFMRIIHEIVSADDGKTDIAPDAVVTEILKTQRKPTMCFLISDFLTEPDQQAIGKLNFRHELIPIRIADPMECELPAGIGTICLQDPESGSFYNVNMNSAALRQAYNKAVLTHRRNWETCFNRQGITLNDVRTDDDFIPVLRSIFTLRSKHFAR